MATNYADLLARVLRQGSLPAQQSGSFPNFDFQELLSPVPQVQSPVTQAFEKGFSISPALADFQERAKQREYNLEHRITGPDQPDEAPGLGVPDLPGTLENAAGLVSTLATRGSPLGLMGTLVAAGLNPNAQFGSLGAPGFGSAFSGLTGFGQPEPDFDFGIYGEGPEPGPGEFADYDPNGIAYSSLGYGETDFGTGFSSRDLGGLEDGVGPNQDATTDMGLAQAIDESFNPDAQTESVGYGEEAGDTDAADGGSVICTELNRLGVLSDDIYVGDDKYGKTLSSSVMRGYHMWGRPSVRIMKRSKRAVWWATKLGVPCATEMAFRAGSIEKGSLLGKALLTFGLPLCWVLGKVPALLPESIPQTP